MGAQLKATPETRCTSEQYRIEEVKMGPQFLPHYAERHQSQYRFSLLISQYYPVQYGHWTHYAEF